MNIETQCQEDEGMSTTLHQAEQELFWAPEDHGSFAIIDFAGTQFVSSAAEQRTQLCILQGCEASIAPKHRAVPWHSHPRYKVLIHSF